MLVARIRGYLIPAIGAAVAAAAGSGSFAVLFICGFLVALTIDVVRLFTLRYSTVGGKLAIRQGLIFRQQRTIPLSRIQNIDLLQNPLHRFLGVAEVRVETASGSEPEATLRVLSLADVDRLKHELHDEPSPPDEPAADTSIARPDEPPHRVLLSIAPRELITLGMISNRGMVLVAIALGVFFEFDADERLGFWGRAQQVVGSFYEFDPDVQIHQQIDHWKEAGQAASAALRTDLMGTVAVGLLIFVGVVLALRLFSVLWSLLRFYGYRLTTDGENLRVSAGMFTKVSATVPRRRVQFISIHRPLLARWLGRASIRIETAGGAAQADEDARATIARRWFVPIVDEHAVAPLMRELRQGLVWNEEEIPWRSMHPRAGRRLTRKAILIAVGISLVGLGVWGPFGALAGPLLLPLFIWHARRYAASLRYARFGAGIVYRSGVLLKKTSVTFFDKVQVVDVLQTPFDRRWRMARLRIDTAAAGPAEHCMHVKLLEEQFACDELTAISRRAAQCRQFC
jgi:putative membrane protein